MGRTKLVAPIPDFSAHFTPRKAIPRLHYIFPIRINGNSINL